MHACINSSIVIPFWLLRWLFSVIVEKLLTLINFLDETCVNEMRSTNNKENSELINTD